VLSEQSDLVVFGIAADGLKYYDLVEGKGPIAEKGSTVQVKTFHFCCSKHLQQHPS
jgi:FKBP-type peptidyl-prolyl cis-trans isomerase